MIRLALPLVALLSACSPEEPTHDGAAPGLYDVPQNPVELTSLGRVRMPHDGLREELTYMLSAEGQMGALVVTDDEHLEYVLLDGTVVPGPSVPGIIDTAGYSSAVDAGLVVVDFDDSGPDHRAWRVSPSGFEPVESWPSEVDTRTGTVVGDVAYVEWMTELTRVDLRTGATTTLPSPSDTYALLVAADGGTALASDYDTAHLLDLSTEAWSPLVLPDGFLGGPSVFDGPDHVVMNIRDPWSQQHYVARIAVDGSGAIVSDTSTEHAVVPQRLDEGPAVAWFDRSDPDQFTLEVALVTFL